MFFDICSAFLFFFLNVLFHNLAFCVDKSSISEVFRLILSVCLGNFLSVFFGACFSVQNRKSLQFIAKNRVSGLSGVSRHVDKTCFLR